MFDSTDSCLSAADDLCRFLCLLLAVEDANHKISNGEDCANRISNRPVKTKTDLGIDNERAGCKCIECSRDQRNPNELRLAVLIHPCRDAGQSKQGDHLVGPCEVSPQCIEALGIVLSPDQDEINKCEDRNCQADALLVVLLLDVQRIRQGQTKCTECGIAGGDRKDNNTDQGDDAADRTQSILADDADNRGRGNNAVCSDIGPCACIGKRHGDAAVGSAEVDHSHGSCCPAHCDEALNNHHVVVGHASSLLGLDGAGNKSSLRAVESGKDAAGNGQEEQRDEVSAGEGARSEVSTEIKSSVCCKLSDGIPVVPYVDQRISLCKDCNEDADCREDQNQTEDRVNTADDLIDREYRCDQIVNKDHGVDDPGGSLLRSSAEAEYLSCCDIAGCVNEYSADKEQQNADKDIIQNIYCLICVVLNELGHLGTAVAGADHAAEIVMHGSADDVSDRDCKECNGSEQNSLNRSEDRAGSCNVQQVDQAVLPGLHRNIIDAVLLRVSGCLTIIRSEDVLAKLTVQDSPSDKDHKAN